MTLFDGIEEYTNGHQPASPADYGNGQHPAGADAYPELRSLRPTAPIIHRDGNANKNGDGRMFSEFLFQQSQWQDELFGFLTLGNIIDPLEKELCKRYYVISMRDWLAEAHNRQGRLDEEEALAGHWLAQATNGELPDELGNPLATPEVDDLLHLWHSAEAYIQRVKIEKNRSGLAAVRHMKDHYQKAVAAKQDVEFRAALLQPAHHQYYWCRVRQYQIMNERTYALAMGWPVNDYTEVKKELKSGVSIHKLIYKMPWACRRLYGRMINSLSDGNTIREHFQIMYTKEYPWEKRAPARLNKLGVEERDDRDDDEEEKDKKDRKNRKAKDRK